MRRPMQNRPLLISSLLTYAADAVVGRACLAYHPRPLAAFVGWLISVGMSARCG